MDRVLEEGHIRVGRIAGAGFGRLRGRVRIPVRLSHGKGTERAGSSLQLLQPKRLPKLRLGRSRLGSRLRCSASPTRSGAEPSPRRPRPAGARARRAPGRRPPESAARPLAECGLERPPHPVVDRLRLGQGYESVGFLGTRHRPREQESTDEHGDQHHARLRHDAARQRAFRGPDPLLPAAHRSPSLGVNRQPARLSPICSHPSPSTWRAT